MKKKRTVLLLGGTNEQIAEQGKALQADCEKRDWSVIKIYENHGKIGEPLCSSISVRSIRGMAQYREFDVLFIESKEVLGHDKEEAAELFRYLNENGVSLISRKEGILNLVLIRSQA